MAAGFTGGSLRQHSQENYMINSPQLSMSFATMEGEIVGVNVALNQVTRQQFSKHNFQLGNYFKAGLSFVGLTWLVVAGW